MTSPRPTMLDVATRAGVSQTTVSLVLNEVAETRLSDETRQRVLEAAQVLGYRHVRRGSARAVSLASTIGVIVDEIATDPWTAQMLDGIAERAGENGLAVDLTVTHADPVEEARALARFSAAQYVGIAYGAIQTRAVDLPEARAGSPIVLLNCYDRAGQFPAFLPGDVDGGRVATERLAQAGHRRIGLICGEAGMDTSHERLVGYKQALDAFGIVFDADLVRPGNWEPSAGYEQTALLMALDKPPTAIFCSNDMMALGCYDRLKEMGLKIPSDVAVMGYDDREFAQFMRPPLTTVLLPHHALGYAAASRLIEGDAGAVPFGDRIVCPLIERQSV